MSSALLFYEWIVWFRDGHHIAQHEQDGTEIEWSTVQDYHTNTSPAKRAAWLPFDPQRANAANLKYNNQICVAKRDLKAYITEVKNGELPFMRRRLSYGYMGVNAGTMIYYYIIGGGGREINNVDGSKSYVDGYYTAIDMNGNSRSCHFSNVVVPVLPPEKGDIENDESETSRS